MKKSVKALLCAATLAVGGGNFCMALGGAETDAELDLSSLEALAGGEFSSLGGWTWGSSQEFINRNSLDQITSDIKIYYCDGESRSSDCYYGQSCYKILAGSGSASGAIIGISPCN